MSVATCPVCGFDLDFVPWRNHSASDEICPCCCIQFGYDDVPEGAGLRGTKEEIYKFWRERWISRGMPWDTLGHTNPPPDWNPREQLSSIGVILD